MRKIACVNQKGGVGKTTICSNLVYALSQKAKVLAIDIDPQAHLSNSLGFFNNNQPGIDDVIRGKVTIEDVAIQRGSNLTIVPAGANLFKLEAVPMGKGKGMLLKKALAKQASGYDILLIDCPPSSGFLAVNALAAVNELLIPVTPDYLGMAGLSHLLHTVKNFERLLGKYQRKWVLMSRVQPRKLSDEVRSKLDYYFGDELLPCYISEHESLAESPSHGQSVLEYAPNTAPCQEFETLATTLLGA